VGTDVARLEQPVQFSIEWNANSESLLGHVSTDASSEFCEIAEPPANGYTPHDILKFSQCFQNVADEMC
jgi:hypothetical protein